MLTDRIIGRVGADLLAKRISKPDQPGDSTALFRLDKLSANQIAAVARAILANPDLLARVDLMIPEALAHGQGLPPEILIPHNAGYVRNNAVTTKAAILTANGNEHNLADTLGHVMAIGAKEMRANPEPWVDAALHVGGLSPVPDDRAVFHAALGGLLASSELSLVQLGEFCSDIVEAMSIRGLPIRDAVGFAMPRAGLPRDSSFFSNAKTFAATRKPWLKAFAKLFAQRAPLLKKLRQNGQTLDPDELRERIEANAADIAEGARLALEAFAAAPAGDQESASAVAQFEWEGDGVYLAFDKPREKQLGLADSTIHFFDHDCEQESSLDVEDRKLLEDLKSRERRDGKRLARFLSTTSTAGASMRILSHRWRSFGVCNLYSCHCSKSDSLRDRTALVSDFHGFSASCLAASQSNSAPSKSCSMPASGMRSRFPVQKSQCKSINC